MAGRRIRLILILAALVALGACVQDDGSRFNPIKAVVPDYDEDAEREMGMEFDRQLQQAVRVIHDPVVAGFMNDLGQEIVRQVEPQPFIYRFRVIEDASLNAFAVPGGYVYFHSGTLLKVGSIDELAGVVGHEIAHVKGHHYIRMRQKAQLPDLLAGIAGIVVAVAADAPEVLLWSQGINVALQLRFSREFETEADQLGGIFAARSGYEPSGIIAFFERILAETRRDPNQIPPYLFTHPEVEDRIATVATDAETLRPARDPDSTLPEALREAQARLELLIDTKRTSLPSYAPPADREKTDPLLAEADRLAERGDADAALVQLARAEAVEPNDPRVPFRIGEILYQAKRYPGAVAAYRRTVRLDPSRARVFYKLGLAYKAAGERHRAVFALEQALRRAGCGHAGRILPRDLPRGRSRDAVVGPPGEALRRLYRRGQRALDRSHGPGGAGGTRGAHSRALHRLEARVRGVGGRSRRLVGPGGTSQGRRDRTPLGRGPALARVHSRSRRRAMSAQAPAGSSWR
jgi:predicted Zn-dependent protease